jgi:hypothetical protein
MDNPYAPPSSAADSSLVIVWWLWLLPALMVLILPLTWYFAVLTRGLESVLSSGIGGDDGLAILGLTVVPFIFGCPPLLVLSLLYGFLFWRHRQRGITLSARFWVPVYGAALLLVMVTVMVVVGLSRGRREYWTPPPSGLNVERQEDP